MMANVRLVLTDRSVAKLLAPAAGQYIVRDEELKGFYLLVGKKSRRYMVQADLRSHNKRSVTIKVSVGDVSEISAQRARQVAKGYLSEISQGGILSQKARVRALSLPRHFMTKLAWTLIHVWTTPVGQE